MWAGHRVSRASHSAVIFSLNYPVTGYVLTSAEHDSHRLVLEWWADTEVSHLFLSL